MDNEITAILNAYTIIIFIITKLVPFASDMLSVRLVRVSLDPHKGTQVDEHVQCVFT